MPPAAPRKTSPTPPAKITHDQSLEAARNQNYARLQTIRSDLIKAEAQLRFWRRLIGAAMILNWVVPIALALLVLGRIYLRHLLPDPAATAILIAIVIAAIACFTLWYNIYEHKTAKTPWEHLANLRLKYDSLLEVRGRFSAHELMSETSRRTVYSERIRSEIAEFRAASQRYRRASNIFQSLIIVGSLATSTITGLSLKEDWLRWVSVSTSFIVGVCAGFTGYYKFREKSFYLQQTADSIEQELNSLELGIGRYSQLANPDALRKFAEECERLKGEQRKREQSLDQAPDAKSSE
jgi:hypothetical protein